jgi:hypothetical protein
MCLRIDGLKRLRKDQRMRTETSWNELDQALAHARVLAKFANLQPDDVDDFKRDHPDFFPQKWWDYQPTQGKPPKKQWELTQPRVRGAWLSEFKMDAGKLVGLLTSVFNPDHLISTILGHHYHPLFATASELYDLPDRSIISFGQSVTGRELDLRKAEPYPFHKTVQWLAGNGWRAKICVVCRRYFVAESSNAKFCTYGGAGAVDGTEGSCFWAYRKKYKAENWKRRRGVINARRREEYALRGKTNRSSTSQRKIKKR